MTSYGITKAGLKQKRNDLLVEIRYLKTRRNRAQTKFNNTIKQSEKVKYNNKIMYYNKEIRDISEKLQYNSYQLEELEK